MSRKSAPEEKRPASLDRESWAEAALYALGEVGLDGFKVEVLARRLGVSKGSFYWHFADRADLVSAALELWEQRGTSVVIEELESVMSPKERLERLLELAFDRLDHLRVEAVLAGAAVSGHAQIAPAYRRVQQARLKYTEQVYRQLGYPKAEARRWALLTFGSYLGQVQLALFEVEGLASERQLAGQVRHLGRVLAEPYTPPK